MSTQKQKPIGFATEGLRLALPVEGNCGIRVDALARIAPSTRNEHHLWIEVEGEPLDFVRARRSGSWIKDREWRIKVAIL
jgi:hypothetical protein